VRPVPLHSELLRLGFNAFIEECRTRGYDVLFPEIRPTNDTQGFGDVYFKNVWKNLREKGQLTSDATIHGMRHRFSTDLKAKKVFSEFRPDLMGHAGANLNEEVYSDIGPLTELKNIVQELPSVTDALPAGRINLPPRAVRKPQPAKRRKEALE
jgi:integrase